MNKFSFALAAVLVFGFASVGNAGGLVIAGVTGTAVTSSSALVVKTPGAIAPVVVAPAAAPKAPAVLAPVAPTPLLGGMSKVTVAPPVVVIRR